MEKDTLDRSQSSINTDKKDHNGVLPNENPDKDAARDRTFSPIRTYGEALSKPQSLRPIRSHISYGGEDGYSCHRNSVDVTGGDQCEEEEQFVVRLRGDHDPDSPRSRSKLRKWTVVFIMAGSALNVYV